MRRGTKGFVGWLAILAIALHTVLWGAVPMAQASAADPFAVICSGGTHTATAADQTDGQLPAPASACDHCTLCGTAAAPSSSLDNIVAEHLLPAKLLQKLAPAAAEARDGVASTPHQARGPPQRV